MEREERAEPETSDPGCGPDWSWLAGEEIVAARSSLDRLTLQFRSGRTLTVRAGLWRRQPVLLFDPWRAP